MLVPADDFQVFCRPAVSPDGGGLGLGHKVDPRIVFEHHRPVRVVGAQGRGNLEPAGQLEEKLHARVHSAVMGKLAFGVAVAVAEHAGKGITQRRLLLVEGLGALPDRQALARESGLGR